MIPNRFLCGLEICLFFSTFVGKMSLHSRLSLHYCHASRLKKHIFFIYSINFHKFLWTGVDNTITTTGNAATGIIGAGAGLYYFWSICGKPLYREKIQFFWKHNSTIWCSRLTGGLTYVLVEGVPKVVGLYLFIYFYKLYNENIRILSYGIFWRELQ